MFDSKKIDNFFEEGSLASGRTSGKSGHMALRRAIKLGFPCVAAALLGLMIVFPKIKKSVDLQDNITIPRKSEMENMHMEETVFYSTDKKNRVNKIVADRVDEVEPGSKVLKIINPKGWVPTDDGKLVITADKGYFDQNASVLKLKKNVKAVLNEKTTVTTEEATYDFNNESGFGSQDVKAVGDWGIMEAEGFTFSKAASLLVLTGFNKVTNEKGVISAEKETRIYQKENKTESYGNARVEQTGGHLTADKIVAYFTDKGKKELLRAEAYGNVVVKTADKTARGAKGQYVTKIGEIVLYGKDDGAGRAEISSADGVVRAYKIVGYLSDAKKKELVRAVITGNVEIVSPKGSAFGDRGVYNLATNTIELFDNVKIVREGNFISGAHAETNLLTKISKIDGDGKTGGRISGTFYKKGKKNENKRR